MKNIFKKGKKISMSKNFTGENAIDVNDVSFKYPGAKKGQLHLDNVSLLFKKGKWTTILGPNGSGKSTLAKSIIRVNKTKFGIIKLHDQHIKVYAGKDFAKKIAYIPQQIDIPHGTSVYDFISFGRNPYLGVTGTLQKKDKEIISKAMHQTGSWEWKDKMMDELSGGQRQKVLISMIVVQDADIILLDEPTTYLDIRNQYELLEMMHHEHEKGKTVITILHDINQAVQYSDYIYILKDGKVHSQGTPDKVISNKVLKEVYGVDATLYTDKGRKFLTDVKLVDFHIGGTSSSESNAQKSNAHRHTIKTPVHINHPDKRMKKGKEKNV